MKTKKQLQEQIEQLQEQIEQLQKQIIELEDSDFQIIKHNKKEFRIYKWENKPFRDFLIPEGFNFAEASLIDELVNLEIFKPEQELWYVFKQRYPKINKDYSLSRLYLSGVLSLRSGDEYLDCSDSGGRVIISRKLKSLSKHKTNKEV